MSYDIILVIGEVFFDHPLSGPAIIKRLLEKYGYTVGIIEIPKSEEEITKLGKPNLFFGISSGSVDSMVRNYTATNRPRRDDPNVDYQELSPDRTVIVYSNWIKKNFKDSAMILGGTEASLRRFVHYDYWSNKLRKPILFDTRAEILVYGNGEKQILEIAQRIKENKSLENISGTSIITKELPKDFVELPSYQEVLDSKEKFCQMQNLLSNDKNLAQKIDNRYVLQYQSPKYTSKDLDEYYELPFTRKIPVKDLRGFEFSVVTHRGCVGNCHFCSLKLIQGTKIISRSEESILREIKKMTLLPYFKGNVDDLGGPSANMYGMDCPESERCKKNCLVCGKLDRSNKRLIQLLKKARALPGINHIFLRSGIRYDLTSPEYLKELLEHHTFDTLRIAPEHINPQVLKLMNKDYGDLKKFMAEFDKIKKETKSNKDLSFYFMVAHPGCGDKESEELAKFARNLKHAELVQVFTPTPMTVSTCMYYTGMNPKNMENVYVPYSFAEKKKQKRMIFGKD